MDEDTPTLTDTEPLLDLQEDLFRRFTTAYERRLAYNALLAWADGYPYLLGVRKQQIPTRPKDDDGYTLELKVASLPFRHVPDEDTLPAGNQYELVDLSVLDDEQTREHIWTQVMDSVHGK